MIRPSKPIGFLLLANRNRFEEDFGRAVWALSGYWVRKMANGLHEAPRSKSNAFEFGSPPQAPRIVPGRLLAQVSQGIQSFQIQSQHTTRAKKPEPKRWIKVPRARPTYKQREPGRRVVHLNTARSCRALRFYL